MCGNAFHVFYPTAFQAEGVLSLPTSVGPFVCPSVRELSLVRTITRHIFELESPNVHQTCIPGYSRLVLKIGVIDLDLQGHYGHFEFLVIWLVRAIAWNGFELESPNLHQICILIFSWLVLHTRIIKLEPSKSFGQFESGFQETALVYWSRPAKGYYTSQRGFVFCRQRKWKAVTQWIPFNLNF